MYSTLAIPCSSSTLFESSQKNSPFRLSMNLSNAVDSISVSENGFSGRNSFRRISVKSRCRKFRGEGLKLRRALDGRCSSPAPVPLKVMISGAPASGKGTQCELIVEKFGLTHISAGDLLRAEVASGTEQGKIAQEYMNAGKLVPSEIVVEMVKNRLAEPDVSTGWLLDGYPRSLEQAEALEAVGIRPQLFILLDVPDSILVGRVVGRRLDPVTHKIYHLTFSPPENEVIAQRLVQRFDDREDKVKARVETYHANVDSVLGVYKDVVKVVDGNRSKHDVFAEIESALSMLQMKGSPAL